MFDALFQAFEDADEELFYVGGFVRDYLKAWFDDDLYACNQRQWPQDFPPRFPVLNVFWNDVEDGKIDVDFATSAVPNKTMEILEKAGLKVIPIGVEFGTIQTIVSGTKVEITTYRCQESYKKSSRKPSVVFGKVLEEDLARRDFTINAIAMDKNFNRIDPFGGFADLITGILETPIEPEVSFGDDPLRMLRFARFWARGIATPGAIAGKAAEKMAKEINTVSKERVFEEMTKILVAPQADNGLKLLASTGLLAEVFPELEVVRTFQTKFQSKDLWDHVCKVVVQTPPDPVLRWAALFHDVGKPDTVREFKGEVSFHGHEARGAEIWEEVANRLKVGNDFKEKVRVIIAESGQFTSLTDNSRREVTEKAVRRFIRNVGEENLDNIYKFTMADMTTSNDAKRARMQTALTNLKNRIDDIIEKDNIPQIKLPKGLGLEISEALGIKPGPMLGVIMKMLLQKRIDGIIDANADFIQEAKNIWIGDEMNEC